MPLYSWQATAASSAVWLNPPGGRIPLDGAFALHRTDWSASAALALTRTSGLAVGAGETVDGLQADIRCLMGADGRSLYLDEPETVGGSPIVVDPGSDFQSLEIALTLDGATAASAWRTALIPWSAQWRGGSDYDASTIVSIGGSADLWGITLTPAQIGASGFGVLVRRRSVYPGQVAGDVFLDAVTLAITTSPPGGGGEGGGGGAQKMAETIRQLTLLKAETTPGTGDYTSMRKANSFRIDPSPRSTKGRNMPSGQKIGSHFATYREWSEGTIEDSGNGLNYTELRWLLASAIAAPVVSQLAAGVQQHQMRLARLTKDAWRYYSLSAGDLDVPNDFRRIPGAFLTSLGMELGKESTAIDGQVIGRRMLDGQAAPTGANEVQTITFSVGPTGGTLALMVAGRITAAITGSASMATAIQTALNAAGVLGASAVVVSGSATSYTVTFSGTPTAGQDWPLIEVAPGGNLLTAATTVTIASTTQGGYSEIPLVPVLPEHWEVWVSSTVGNLGQEVARMTKLFRAKLDIGRGRTPEYFAGRTLGPTFGDVAEGEDQVRLELNGESSSNLKTLLATSRADGLVYVRLEAVGPQIAATGYNYTLRFDMACKVPEDGGFGDSDGVHDRTAILEVVWDQTLGGSLICTMINDLAEASY